MKITEIISNTILEYLNENEQGLVLYHGTPDNGLNIEDIEPDYNLKGLYTTIDKIAAKQYTGSDGKIFSFRIRPTAKILNLGDGNELYEWMVENGLFDDDDLSDVDLENYIKDGKIFQYDISSRTHFADDLVGTAKYMGYDIVIILDDLRGYGDNLAYVVMNMDILIPIGEVKV